MTNAQYQLILQASMDLTVVSIKEYRNGFGQIVYNMRHLNAMLIVLKHYVP